MNPSLPAALAGKQFAVVDVEGNGQRPPEIVEIAVLPIDDVSTLEVRTWLVRPEAPITGFVTRKVHGISNEDVADRPPWSAVMSDVEDLITGRILIAHGAKTEINILTTHLPDWQHSGALDTLRLARAVFPGMVGGHGLENLVAKLSVDTSGPREQRPHRAEFDVWCTWQLLKFAIERENLDYDDLVVLAGVPGYLPAQTIPSEFEASPEPEGLW